MADHHNHANSQPVLTTKYQGFVEIFSKFLGNGIYIMMGLSVNDVPQLARWFSGYHLGMVGVTAVYGFLQV